MSSIMRARSGLTRRWEGSGAIRGSFLEPKVARPSMLGIGRPDRHALPRVNLVDIRRPRRVLPSRASGFVLRRILVVAVRSGEGLLTDPTAGAQPGRREPPLLPQSRRSGWRRLLARWGDDPTWP